MADDNTISSLQSHIRDLEQEIIDTKKMVNRLLVRKGQPPMFADASLALGTGSVFDIRKDRFHKKQSLASAVRDYLDMRHKAELGPGDLNEIYVALCKGGFQFETANEDNRKKNLKVCLQKNTALFHRVGDDSFGLTSFYGIDPNGNGASKGKSGKTSKRKTAARKQAENKGREKTKVDQATKKSDGSLGSQPKTMIEALRAAVNAIGGEFTKKDVISWIVKHHPELKAEQKKTSIDSMMANQKDELKIEKTHVGKGIEPHRYRKVV